MLVVGLADGPNDVRLAGLAVGLQVVGLTGWPTDGLSTGWFDDGRLVGWLAVGRFAGHQEG